MGPAASTRTNHLSKVIQLGFIVGIALLWYAVTVTQWISPLFLPNPVEVLRMFVQIIVTGEAWPDVKVTFMEVAIAFPIAAITGTIVGYLVSISRYGTRVFEPLSLGHLRHPDHRVLSAVGADLRHRAGIRRSRTAPCSDFFPPR